MNRTTIVLGIALVLILSATVAPAQSIKKQQERATSKRPISSKTETQFVPVFWQADISPTKYLANKPDKAFNWVEAWVKAQAKSLPKTPDSFSTEDERNKYQLALEDSIKSLAPLPLELTCTKKYNAEGQFYKVNIKVISGYYKNLVDDTSVAMRLRALDLPGHASETLGVYKAQNGYGATIDVQKIRSTEFFVAAPDGQEPPGLILTSDQFSKSSFMRSNSKASYMFSGGRYELTIPITSSEARKADEDIVCFGVVSLSTSPVINSSGHFAATREIPTEVTYVYHGILGKLDHILVFNKISGDVYTKISRPGL